MDVPRATIAVSFARPADQRLVREQLRAHGHQVVTVTAATAGVDLVLLDLPSLHRHDSDFLRRLKEDDSVFLPVILAIDRRGNAAAWLNTGLIDDCLRLPFSKAELISRINVFIRLRQRTLALAEKSEEIRALVRSSEDHIFMLDQESRFIASNNRAQQPGQDGSQDIIGRRLDQVLPSTVAGTLQRAVDEVLSTRKVQTLEYSLAIDGATRHRHLTLFPVTLAGGRKRVGGICRDITAQVETEQSRFLLAKAMDYTAESVIITDRDRKIIFVNAGFEKISGYSRQEALGRSPAFLRSGRHDAAFYRHLLATIHGGRIWKGDFVNRRKDGRIYVVEATISPVFDEQGEISHFVSVRRDVTEERRFEKVRQRMQRFEAIGTLAGGIAHDFNNILTPIMGYSELSKSLLPADSQIRDNLEQIVLAANRARELVRQILTFSRQNGARRLPLDIRMVVKEALKLIRAALPADIRIEQQIEAGKGYVIADPTEIHQVVMNLCTNARYAMDEIGGTLKVRLVRVDIDSGRALSVPGLHAGPYLQLTVEDTGCGISPRVLDRIFEPYFTTRGEDRGTGLGLATVHGIVTGMDGVVTVQSEQGQGTIFDVFLPAVEPPAGVGQDGGDLPVTGGNERILFVDDEPMIADLGRKMLGQLGYAVTATSDPVAALELLRKNPDCFDLVITDMTMPGMSGMELVREIGALRPALPVIACTGFNRKMPHQDWNKQKNVRQLLMKPMGFKELAQAVRKALDTGVP
ncbi:MAG TPA: PAS domain S-box protein [Desulfobulbus sp.]|nr:PAS domain S-box protein [Desulfobulbus sp.]